jgi:hypothetical protein
VLDPEVLCHSGSFDAFDPILGRDETDSGVSPDTVWSWRPAGFILIIGRVPEETAWPVRRRGSGAS